MFKCQLIKAEWETEQSWTVPEKGQQNKLVGVSFQGNCMQIWCPIRIHKHKVQSEKSYEKADIQKNIFSNRYKFHFPYQNNNKSTPNI